MITRYTRKHVGCYADGALSHQHIRGTLASMMTGHLPQYREYQIQRHAGSRIGAGEPVGSYLDVRDSLEDEMPDDAWDEIEALDYLNEHFADSTVSFEMVDGDLMLVPVNSWWVCRCGGDIEAVDADESTRCPDCGRYGCFTIAEG